ncbi:hypothetical protein [Nocardia sp. IFM 10818]
MRNLWMYSFYNGSNGTLEAENMREALESIEGGNLDSLASMRAVRIREMFTDQGWDIWSRLIPVEISTQDGRKPTFYEVKNTFAFEPSGEFDPVGLANLRYLADHWSDADGVSFNGCVSFTTDALAPGDAVEIFEKLDDYRVLDMDTFFKVCEMIDRDPNEIEHYA